MLSLVIQAGGESRRMGRDKALVQLAGRPLILWAIDRLSSLADEILITSNDQAALEFLGYPVFTDEEPESGALGGLRTALKAAAHPLAAVVACDMPFASPALLQREAELAGEEGIGLVLPRTAAGIEPFHAVYRPEICLPLIEGAIGRGERRVASWFAQARMREIGGAEIAALDPDGLCFFNVNSPDDLAWAEGELARRREA